MIKTEIKGRVAQVILDRPEKKNALSTKMLQALLDTANDFRDRTDIFAIVLSGGPKYFTAGMDLADPAFYGLENATLAQQRKVMALAPRVCQAWEDLEQITVAAIEGFCLGGGVSLTSSCDFRVMSQSSYIRAPEIDWGMNMSWATLPRLLHLIGPARTKELIIFNEKVSASAALSWGFAQWVCNDGEALEKATQVAEKAASKPFAPAAMTKASVNALATAMDRLASHMDRDQFLLSVFNPQNLEMIKDFSKKG